MPMRLTTTAKRLRRDWSKIDMGVMLVWTRLSHEC